MKGFTRKVYGGPEVLRLEEVEKPLVKDGHILVKVMANSANPADWHILRGAPFFARFTYGLLKPKKGVQGCDFAGVVEAVGKDATDFKVGHRVFGSTLSGGAFAEYISVPAAACGHMPANATFAEMACLPMAGVTALQAILTHGALRAGETVLVNGAAGGVGHFAVQIAKHYGARVTAVCAGRNAEFVKELGAEHVIAHDRERISEHTGRYDLIIDVHGNLSYNDHRRMGGRGVAVGFTTMKHMLSLLLRAAASKFSIGHFTAAVNTADLETLASLVQHGHIRPHIEKTYTHKDIPEAIAYIENMRTRGKVVMTWENAVHV